MGRNNTSHYFLLAEVSKYYALESYRDSNQHAGPQYPGRKIKGHLSLSSIYRTKLPKLKQRDTQIVSSGNRASTEGSKRPLGDTTAQVFNTPAVRVDLGFSLVVVSLLISTFSSACLYGLS